MNARVFKTRFLAGALAAATAVAAHNSRAATLVPTTGATIDWTDVNNWDTATVPNAVDAPAVITPGTGDRTLQLNAAITVGSLAITTGGADSFQNEIAAGTGGTLIFNNTAADLLTLATTADNPGKSTISAPITFSSATTVSVGTNGTLVLSGPISGAGTLVKTTGAGSLIINGAVSLVGGPSVNIVEGTLGGNGSFAANVRLDNGGNRGILSPGDPAINGGIGTLTFADALNLRGAAAANPQNSARIVFEIASPTSYDQVIANAGVNVNANSNANQARLDLSFSPTFSGGSVGDFIALIDKTSAGSITNLFRNSSAAVINDGNLLSFTNGAGDIYSFSYQYDGGSGNNDFGLQIESITPIPEPSALVIAGLGALGIALLSRGRHLGLIGSC